MDEHHERKFKGVWIESEVWLNTKLSWMEKCLLAEVNSLDDPENGCTASNKYLSEMFHTSPASIANMLSKLRSENYLETASFDGRKRSIRVKAALTHRLRQGSPPGEGTLNPQVNADPVPVQGEILVKVLVKKPGAAEAAEIYEAYPRKVARPDALKAIGKVLKRGEIAAAALLERTQLFSATRNGDMDFCPNPATWFNQERFKDDPETWKPRISNGNGYTKPRPTYEEVHGDYSKGF